MIQYWHPRGTVCVIRYSNGLALELAIHPQAAARYWAGAYSTI